MYARVLTLPRLLPVGVLALALAFIPQLSQAQQDPPPGDSRIARIQGPVSIQPAGVDSWGLVDPNMPVNPGDRLFADPAENGRAELQAGPTRTYFAHGADITLTDFSANGVEIGIANGSADFHSDGFAPGQSLYVSTPNGGVSVQGRAGFRVDVYPDQQTTVITALRGSDPIRINGGGGFSTVLDPNQSIQLTGTNPVFAQPLYPAEWDDLQHWAENMEHQREVALSLRYVNPAMIGYADLDGAGDWQPESPYGPIWYPHVEAGWAPYRHGHWVNRPFYGWVWVADEPWGAAPFHYGRWVVVSGRWGWIPGPRETHPVWSPAQVVFAGGIHVGGAGLSVWFPLGPGEPYKPWYPCSPHYIDQVNIANIHPAPTVVVRNTYVNVVNVTNITYVNRSVGVTAMRQDDFAAGHPAARVAVKIDVNLVQHVQPAEPTVRPPAQPVVIHPVARPVAVQAARPLLINHQGQQVAATANARPVVVPVKAAPPAPRPLPGRQTAGTATLGNKPAPPSMQSPVSKPPVNQPITGRPAPTQAERPQLPSTTPPGARPPIQNPASKPQPAPTGRPTVPAPAANIGEHPVPPTARPTTPPGRPQPAPALRPATPQANPNQVKPAVPKPGTVKPGEEKPANGKLNPKDTQKDQKDRERKEKARPEKPE
ncbi:MAG TPA: DUF6600 domain-containing protein [Acidobacteriaceae bacterium]|nr:DUF6600 domain-containing protein [Acidobacteriaceae bacterium]